MTTDQHQPVTVHLVAGPRDGDIVRIPEASLASGIVRIPRRPVIDIKSWEPGNGRLDPDPGPVIDEYRIDRNDIQLWDQRGGPRATAHVAPSGLPRPLPDIVLRSLERRANEALNAPHGPGSTSIGCGADEAAALLADLRDARADLDETTAACRRYQDAAVRREQEIERVIADRDRLAARIAAAEHLLDDVVDAGSDTVGGSVEQAFAALRGETP